MNLTLWKRIASGTLLSVLLVGGLAGCGTSAPASTPVGGTAVPGDVPTEQGNIPNPVPSGAAETAPNPVLTPGMEITPTLTTTGTGSLLSAPHLLARR